MHDTQDFIYDNQAGNTCVRVGGAEHWFAGSPAGLGWRVVIDGQAWRLLPFKG
jgi:hypothetical protein